MDPSGIRIGTAALASRDIGPDAMERLAGWIDQVVGAVDDDGVIERVRAEVREFASSYPAPGLLES